MRIVTNKKLAKRNRQIATYLFFITFLVLIGGFFLVNVNLFDDELTFDPAVIIGQALVLPIALILTLVSIRMTNLWVRHPRPEDAIVEGLKGLSKKSVFYSYFHFPARHILVCPQGIFVFITRWHDGRFTIEGDKWTTHKNVLSKIFSALRFDGIGNPNRDADRAVNHVRKLLADIAPEAEINPVIVFVDPRAQVTLVEPAVPVLFADSKLTPNITDHMREISQGISDQRSNGTSSKGKKASMPLTDEQISTFEAKTIQ